MKWLTDSILILTDKLIKSREELDGLRGLDIALIVKEKEKAEREHVKFVEVSINEIKKILSMSIFDFVKWKKHQARKESLNQYQ
jgi:hypothetical protein